MGHAGSRAEGESAARADGRGGWATLGRERRGSAGEREGGEAWAGIGLAEEGEEFSFFFLFSLFFFLNSFSPLYKYSFMFPRCQNEILYVKCY
jgi:hypothetical protein